MKTKVFVHLAVFFAVLMSAHAAQDTTVVIDNAIIRMEPRDRSKVLEYLPQGTEVRVSNYPLEGGWYKVRAKSGAYGWIHESYLSVVKTAENPEDVGGPEQLELSSARDPEDKREMPKPETDRKWFLRAYYGFQFQSAADLNDIFTFTEFKSMNYYGGEAGYFIQPKLALMLRGDYLYKDLAVKESVSQITYNLGLRSAPVMAGIEYYLVKLPPLRLSIGAFAGMAFSTQFTVKALSLASPNSITLSDRPLTTLVRLNLTRPLGRTFSVFVEGGYRYLVSKELSTTDASNMQGGQVFIKNGHYQARIIDLSAFTVAAGLGAHF